ncbi:MAG TPA: hypothetical protein VGI76_07215 [Solirubrobacteraceae bacterium]|jgi:hypothetical protein
MRLIPSHAPSARGRGRLIEELRRAIDCLPVQTREAMLAGVGAQQPIIVGAYTDGDGGVCPMLAAHRRGGRTDFLAFARAWDRFTGAGRRPRRASRRELGVLISHLEASLLEDAAPDLARAVAEHHELLARKRPACDGDPPGERIRVRRLLPRRLPGRARASASA